MKVKYLFGSLLGGILLAACTADDALDSGLAASKANPSAPVFTVSLGDNGSDTRAFMGGSTGFTLNFEKGDLLSLYHGGAESKLEGYGNAIYKAAEEISTEGAKSLAFMTQAMVKEGYALMVWPADTTFKNDGTSAPVLTIDLDQKYNAAYNVQGGKLDDNGDEIDGYLEAITWLKTPYMSEILDIAKHENYNDEELNKTNTAGYGRKYDIKLKRVGSTMKLDMKRLNEPDLSDVTRADGNPVTPLTFDKVTLSVEGGATPFTYEIPVKVGTDTPHSQNDGTKAIWAAVSEVDENNAKGESAVSTEHITSPAYTGEGCISSAYFTLLPTNVGASSNYASATATIETYYGNVAVTGADEGSYDNYSGVSTGGFTRNDARAKWHKEHIEASVPHLIDYSVRSGLAEFLTGMYSAAGTSSTFAGERIGHAGTRYLDVDMSTVKMDGLHIKDEIQLMDVMAVYRDLAKDQFGDGKTIKLYLDGGTKHPSHKELDSNDPEEFLMHEATWKKVVEEMEEGNLEFIPCRNITGEVCKYIRLVSEGDKNDEIEEVPTLKFKQLSFGGRANAVVVRLDGEWKYTTAEENAPKELSGVGTLEVIKDAKLELQNYVLAENNNNSRAEYRDQLLIDVKEGGELFTQSYNTRVGVDVENSGTITITRLEDQPETQVTSFRMANGKTLTNKAGTDVVYKNEADGVVNGVVKHLTAGTVKFGGVINDGSRLRIVDNSGAKIYNYGTINLTTHDARLYVTENVKVVSGNTLNAFVTGHSATNQIGTIKLYDAEAGEDNVKIDNKDLRGFIKLYVSDPTDGAATADLYGEVANYIVLETGVSSYEDKDGIAFVELSQNNLKEVRFGNASLQGLIVNPGAAANIQKNTTVTVAKGAYVKGSIWRASALNIPAFQVYFGGDAKDQDHVTAAN